MVCPRSKWANKFMIGLYGERAEVIENYERSLRGERPDLMAALPELRGKDLMCWCAPARARSLSWRRAAAVGERLRGIRPEAKP